MARVAAHAGPSEWVLAMAVECYRLSGVWPETLTYEHHGKSGVKAAMGVSPELRRAGEAARASFDAEQHAEDGLREVYGWGHGLGK